MISRIVAFCAMGSGLLALVFGCARPSRPGPEAGGSSSARVAVAPVSVRSATAATQSVPSGEDAFAEREVERSHMVSSAIARGGVTHERGLAAMRRVPRHRFVPEPMRGEAYANRPLPIGWGQTISQPLIVALMTAAADPKSTDRCLEIGTGSGYQAAVLAELCERTYSIEYLPELAAFAKKNLASLGYRVELRTGDGYQGWPDAAPFDVILVTAAPEKVPAPLLTQLAVGGRLVVPVGPEAGEQSLELYERLRAGTDAGAFKKTMLADVRFVPLVGEAQRKP